MLFVVTQEIHAWAAKPKQHCTRGGEGGEFVSFGHNGTTMAWNWKLSWNVSTVLSGVEALHPAGIFKSSKSRGLLVSLASVSRSWIINELQITGFVANLLCSGRAAKFSVHAKSIYRSTDAKKWWQTFLVKKFFFLQLSRKHEDRSALK